MSNEQSLREDIAARFLRESIRFLKSQGRSERNTSGMIIAGTAAFFLSDKSLFHDLEQIWNATPRKDHYAGKNFTEMVSIDPNLHAYKVMSKDEFLEYVRNLAPERYEPCLDNDLTLEQVLQTAKSALDFEEIGCTYAVLGNHEKALEIADLPELEKFRREGILRTIQMEKLRNGEFDTLDFSVLALGDSGVHPWNAGYLALCALGRLPYIGYPYPDW